MDVTLNKTVMEHVQAAVSDRSLNTGKPVTLFGEYFTRKDGSQGFQVLSIRNALSDEEFAAQNAARRAARAG